MLKLFIEFTIKCYYTADRTVEYKQPVTKFDVPTVTFISHQTRSGVFIGVKNSEANNPQEFRKTIKLTNSIIYTQ